MRCSLVLALVLVTVSACESKRSAPEQAPHATLVDLPDASSLAAVRTAFNAHKGEARFLTLLSPT